MEAATLVVVASSLTADMLTGVLAIEFQVHFKRQWKVMFETFHKLVEEFRALAPMYYRGSAAAIIVYDITKEETLQTLKNWVKELGQHGPPNIVVAIAGNKCDLTDAREVLEKDAKDYADSIHAVFVETSAKNAININELFAEISRRIPSTSVNPGANNKGFKLRRQPTDTRLLQATLWQALSQSVSLLNMSKSGETDEPGNGLTDKRQQSGA
ncbi:hypothetical protein scyTo_0018108 [Scyliorhinus torazame]|uniref:Ras-related protein Rab-22A n=1 Tax=Scyliorhinus torazame TaxID=75743 RepID=A0A401Q4W4_SCYTO|nr:hypothetical protein [Scyliorhinus torazame]